MISRNGKVRTLEIVLDAVIRALVKKKVLTRADIQEQIINQEDTDEVS